MQTHFPTHLVSLPRMNPGNVIPKFKSALTFQIKNLLSIIYHAVWLQKNIHIPPPIVFFFSIYLFAPHYPAKNSSLASYLSLKKLLDFAPLSPPPPHQKKNHGKRFLNYLLLTCMVQNYIICIDS